MLDSPQVVRGDDLVRRGAIERLIERALGTPRPSKPVLALSLAAPLAPAERLLLMRGTRKGVLWSTSAEEEHCGVGAARTLSGSGECRFAQLREGAARLFQSLSVIALDDAPAPSPRLIGGFAFKPGPAPSTMWEDFGAALFILPRVAYTRRGDRAWLTLTAEERELASAAGRTRLAAEACQALRLLRSGSDGTPPDLDASSRAGGALRIEESIDDWSTLVAGICAAIAAGHLEKAVAARRVVVRGTSLPNPVVVLERLRHENTACTRFALAVGERTFLGASPECLVRRMGARVLTEAVAGSMPRAARDADESPLRSAKESAEHAIVVREIHAALAPLCASLCRDAQAPLRLRHLLHLRTRFAGVLKEPRHVLDLVAALHPTPAVGGTPRRAALAWLDEHEGADRGFYGGPFGAFDSSGDGHFIVAIRSALLGPDGAHLFAGAGIVAGSEPLTEWAETCWKLRSVLTAIGVR